MDYQNPNDYIIRLNELASHYGGKIKIIDINKITASDVNKLELWLKQTNIDSQNTNSLSISNTNNSITFFSKEDLKEYHIKRT